MVQIILRTILILFIERRGNFGPTLLTLMTYLVCEFYSKVFESCLNLNILLIIGFFSKKEHTVLYRFYHNIQKERKLSFIIVRHFSFEN